MQVDGEHTSSPRHLLSRELTLYPLARSSSEALPGAQVVLDPAGRKFASRKSCCHRSQVDRSTDGPLNPKEASQRGDAIDPSTVMQHLKASAASFLLQMAAGVVASEMEELGLGDARAGLGLGSTKRRGWVRAEWKGLNLR